MINLLPHTQKHIITKEYRFRLLAIGLVFLLVIIGVSILLLLPSYVIVISKKQTAQQKIDSFAKSESDEHKKLVSQMAELKQATVTLAPEKSGINPSDLIAAIVAHKTSDIIVNGISYLKSGDGKLTANIVGVAKTRESLVSFKEGLEQEQIIGKIDLPVSNLAQEVNIQFNLAATGK